MCMYLVNGNFLGQRLIGYDFFDSKTKGFIGMSEKQVIDKLKKNERVYGFKLVNENETDMLALDSDGFNMNNLQLKSGVNNLSWLNDSTDCDMNVAWVVVSVQGAKSNKVYEVVNARHARVSYDESKIKMLLELGVPVAGVKLVNNKLAVCDGVEIADSDTEQGAV